MLFLSTDAQKFKVKFDECKEEVRKNLEKSGIKMTFLEISGGSLVYNCSFLELLKGNIMQTHSVLRCKLQLGTFSVCYINMQNVKTGQAFFSSMFICMFCYISIPLSTFNKYTSQTQIIP